MAKEFLFKGKTLNDLSRMTVKEFSELINARQRRSLKRGFTEEQKRLLEKIKKAKKGDYKKTIKTHCRDMIIIPDMLDIKLGVYRGKEFVFFEIVPEMLGHYLGEFALTRNRVSHSAPGVGATRSSVAAKK